VRNLKFIQLIGILLLIFASIPQSYSQPYKRIFKYYKYKFAAQKAQREMREKYPIDDNQNKVHKDYIPYWERKYGVDGRDEARTLVEAEDKGILLAGYTMEKDQKFTWVIKVDAYGIPLWGKTFNRSGNDVIECMIRTQDNGYALAGRTWVESDTILGKYFDVWVMRLDSTGNMVWDKNFGGQFDDYAEGIAQTTDGNFVIAATYESDLDNDADFWVLKIDSMGNLLEDWDKKLGGTRTDAAHHIAATSDGGFVATGFTQSKGGRGRSMWTMKYDSQGNSVWDETYRANDSCDFNEGTSVVETLDLGTVAVGFSKADGEQAVNYDMTVVKYDQNGALLWDTVFHGANWGEASSVCATFDKGVAITGFSQSLNGDKSHFWITKIDSAGNVEYEEIFKRKSVDYATAIIETGDKGLAIAGTTYSMDARSWDYALLKFKNKNYPDTLGICINDPPGNLLNSAYPIFTFNMCINSPNPISDIQLYQNDSLIENHLHRNLDLKDDRYCPFSLTYPLHLKVGKNTVQVIVIDRFFNEVEEKFVVYYLPLMRIRW